MSLYQQITSWDNKSADAILAVYQQFHDQDFFIDQIIELIEKLETQIGASWLLKKWLESGNRLDEKRTTQLYQYLHQLDNWQARLHVLQSLPYLNISTENHTLVYDFLKINLSHVNKFVRAWTYNGFHVLSIQHPQYQQETQSYFEMAMRDEAASVKARIRQIQKQTKS